MAATTEPTDLPDPTDLPKAPVVDVAAEIAKALAEHKKQFDAAFKAATGFDDLKSFTDAKLQSEGKLQELADTSKSEAANWKNKFESAAISAAILGASADAIDAGIVKDLLAGKGVVDEAGNVTIDGSPINAVVAQLLKDKPFLAKAQGDSGSGAPQNTDSGVKNPWSAEHFNLTEQVKLTKSNPAEAARLKAAAGK